MDNAERRKKAIIIGAAVILVLIVVLILALALRDGTGSSDKETCTLVTLKPDTDLANKRAIPSQDSRALVRFGAYLSLWTSRGGHYEDYRYLELELQRANYSDFYKSYRYLTLDTDCAIVEFEIQEDSLFKGFHAKKIVIKPKSPQAPFKQCQINPTDINLHYGHYWSCSEGRFYYCYEVSSSSASAIASTNEQARVGIQLELLEFEMDGDPAAMAAGRFDKTKELC